MAKKVGTLIKEARTAAGLTQEQLARKIKGLSAADLGKAERGEIDLTQSILKEIAKATGVTQASLINASKSESKTSSSKKTTSSKTSSAKTSSSKTSSKKTTAEKDLTAAEKKLIEAYRAATSDNKKTALKILKGEGLDLSDVMGQFKNAGKDPGDLLGGLKESLGSLLGKK